VFRIASKRSANARLRAVDADKYCFFQFDPVLFFGMEAAERLRVSRTGRCRAAFVPGARAGWLLPAWPAPGGVN